MKKWHMVIDVAKCEDCNNCFISCKDEFVDNEFPPYSVAQPRHGHRWIDILRKERGQFPLIDVAYLPVPCMHCDDAPCFKAGNGAVYRTSSGAVIIDPVKARGRKELAAACPYGAIWWNEEKGVVQKCTMCAHLLADGWKEPRCVQACPTGAMRFLNVEDDEMAKMIKDEGLEVLHPEYGTRPSVYYKDLYRFFRCFIGGSVAIESAGVVDCAEGARVGLFRGGEKLAEAVTNNYGDFKFDDLEENSGAYSVRIEYEGRDTKTIEIDLTTSRNVGTIML